MRTVRGLHRNGRYSSPSSPAPHTILEQLGFLVMTIVPPSLLVLSFPPSPIPHTTLEQSEVLSLIALVPPFPLFLLFPSSLLAPY